MATIPSGIGPNLGVNTPPLAGGAPGGVPLAGQPDIGATMALIFEVINSMFLTGQGFSAFAGQPVPPGGFANAAALLQNGAVDSQIAASIGAATLANGQLAAAQQAQIAPFPGFGAFGAAGFPGLGGAAAHPGIASFAPPLFDARPFAALGVTDIPNFGLSAPLF